MVNHKKFLGARYSDANKASCHCLTLVKNADLTFAQNRTLPDESKHQFYFMEQLDALNGK